MRPVPATTFILTAALATSVLAGCGRAEEQASPSVPPVVGQSDPATATSMVPTPATSTTTAATTSSTAAATTAVPTSFAEPQGSATRLAIANPGSKTFIDVPINRYKGPYNGIFEPAPKEAAWWQRGRYGAPGQSVTSVIAAHVTFNKIPDLFYQLHTAKPGARIVVTYSSGDTTEWEVTELVSAKKEIIASSKTPEGKKVWGTPGLRLITCDSGSGYRPDGHLVGNTVVLAKRVG